MATEKTISSAIITTIPTRAGPLIAVFFALIDVVPLGAMLPLILSFFGSKHYNITRLHALAIVT
jgi:hypothetical protein